MNYLAIKDLKSPCRVRETLAEYGSAWVTNNGKPMALLIDLEEGETPEQLCAAVRAARARSALSSLREAARRNGSATLSPAGIEVEIRAARAKSRAGQSAR
jgi:hypothetical protein